MARRNEKTVNFYHYTDQKGLDGIMRSGYIEDKPAGHRHAHFGPGTYGTSLPPSAGAGQIAHNNWKSRGNDNIQNGRTDWAIKVQAPAHMVERVGTQEGRDVLVYRGGKLDLDNHQYQVVRGPNHY